MRKVTFITGAAGTGKSHKLREAIAQETRPHLICAPTGVAAVNVGGSTLHRTFKINSDSGHIGKRWTDVEVVYIDEASMMGAKLFDQVIQGAPNAEFVLIGDMAQLPPVKDKFWFQTQYIDTLDVSVERLTKQWRQDNDPDFVEVLNSIRDGSVSREDLRWMYTNSIPDDENEDAVVLAYRNDTVRAINAERMLDLPGKMYQFEAVYGGIMKQHDCIAEADLYIKSGAQVVMLNNDPEGRWSNGTRGKVLSVYDEHITVMIGKKSYEVGMHQWKMKVPQEVTPLRRQEIETDLSSIASLKMTPERISELRFALQTGVEYVVAGTCKQYPMKLSYALTVHKSQGMTLDAAHIITSGFTNTHGIGYVAISRVRSLDTLSFDKKPIPNDFRFNKLLTQYI